MAIEVPIWCHWKCLCPTEVTLCSKQRKMKAAESNVNPPCNRRNKTSKFLVLSPRPLLLLTVTCSEKETEILVAGNTQWGNFDSP